MKKPIIPKKPWDKKSAKTKKKIKGTASGAVDAFRSRFVGTNEGVSTSMSDLGVSLKINAKRTIEKYLCEDVVGWLLAGEEEVFNPQDITDRADGIRAESLISHPSFIRVSARKGSVFYMDSKGKIRKQTIKGAAPKIDSMVIEKEGIDENFFLYPDWFNHFRKFVKAGSSVLLIGPAGAGKSEAVEQLFKELNQRLLIVSCNPSQTADDLEGVTDLVDTESGGMKTVFNPAAPAIALEKGYGLLLDEADAVPPEACYALYRIIDGRSMEILRKGYEGSINRHDDFRVMGTQNTEGRGDSMGLFHGRALQDEAFLDRWDCFIRVGYPTKDQEAIIINKRIGLPMKYAENVVKTADLMRKALESEKVMMSVSLRRTLAVSRNLVAGMSPEDAWMFSVLNRATMEDRISFEEILKRVYGGKYETPLGAL